MSGADDNTVFPQDELKTPTPPDDQGKYTPQQIREWHQKGKLNPQNVIDAGEAFLAFHDGLNGTDGPLSYLPTLATNLNKYWTGNATSAPEAQRQLSLLWMSARELMDKSQAIGNSLKSHGENMQKYMKYFEPGGEFTQEVRSSTNGAIDPDNNFNPQKGHEYHQLSKKEPGPLTPVQASKKDWDHVTSLASGKLKAHNDDIVTTHNNIPFSAVLQLPPDPNSAKTPPDGHRANHGLPVNNPGGPGSPSGPGANGPGSVPNPPTPHIPQPHLNTGAPIGGHDQGTLAGLPGNGPGGTPPSGGNPFGSTPPGGTPTTTPVTGGLPGGGPGGTPGVLPPFAPTGLGGGGTPNGGRNPFGKSGFGGLGDEPGAGRSGVIGEAAAAQGRNGGGPLGEEAAAARATEAGVVGRNGGMPMGMPMGGAAGGGGQEQDHERTTWLTEDEDVWSPDGDATPPVIG